MDSLACSRLSLLGCSVSSFCQELDQPYRHTDVLSRAVSLRVTVVTLNNIAQRRQDYGHPTYAAHVDLQAAFDAFS